MDKHSDRPDDLSELERKLSAWEPTAAGLDAEAMLFAAGRAAARPGSIRFVWPTLTVVLAILATGLGIGLSEERTERKLLAERLRQQAPPFVSPSAPAAVIPTEPPSADAPSPESFLAAHRALENGLETWRPRPAIPGDPSVSEGLVMRVGQPYALLDP
jgi:hypothetical protein